MSEDWRPRAAISVLRERARLLARIRAFFDARGLWEAQTQILDVAATTDPHIHSLSTRVHGPSGTQVHYLHTSPEFQMKRLLAAGSGPIYQIATVFRDEERGDRHLTEFTLLEWYRPGWDHHRLMDEVDEFLQAVAGAPPARRSTYADVFRRHVGVDPHRASEAMLREAAMRHGGDVPADLTRDELLDFLMGMRVEPLLGRDAPLLVYDYPAGQAALARIRPGPVPVAERFELYWRGLELANGFHELTDPEEQARRFLEDRRRRRAAGLPDVPHDRRLVDALRAGLPACAGVALGVDRLLMTCLGLDDVAATVAFPLQG